MIVKSGKSSRLADCLRIPLGRRISAGVGHAEGRDRGGGNHRRRGADVESSTRCDGRLRDDVPPSEPFGPDDAHAHADCDRDSWQVLLHDGRAHHRPRAIDRCPLWRGRRLADRRHVCGRGEPLGDAVGDRGGEILSNIVDRRVS